MRIGIITPAPPHSRYGNRVTALRWARILRGIGHSVTIEQVYSGRPFDLLVALHARRSHDSTVRFRRKYPNRPIIVALTGTDLYRDLHTSRRAQQSLEIATRVIVLQPKAIQELNHNVRDKVRVIYQSAVPKRKDQPKTASSKAGSGPADCTFDVSVIGHLREVKDPFRTALASRLLPSSSCLRVLQVGGAMTRRMEARARAEMKKNPRFLWLGEQPRWRVQQILLRSRVCVISSQMEGGPNILSEAIVNRVPVLASKIPGTIGILGEDYMGYFNAGDTQGLAQLLILAEIDPAFLTQLKDHCEGLVHLFDPEREELAWSDLLNELGSRV